MSPTDPGSQYCYIGEITGNRHQVIVDIAGTYISKYEYLAVMSLAAIFHQ